MPQFLRRSLVGLATIVAAASAVAQGYPTKPIRLIVPLPPGTASDVLARTVATSLSNVYKQQVVTDNRPGGGGLIGSRTLINAKNDGYTLALIAAPHLAAPLMQNQPPYRPLEDVTPVIHVASIPSVLVVAAGVPAKNIGELIRLIKAKPGQLNYASFGVGTVGHLSALILNTAAGLNAVHVPFKELASINSEMSAGTVHYFVPTTTASQMLVNPNSKLRALAVTSVKRSGMYPALPTVAELGLPEAQSDGWFGIVAPAGTPSNVVSKLNVDIAKLLRQPDVQETFARQDAFAADETSPTAFERLLKSEYARFQVLVNDAGLRPQ